jgi:hypothetical protein
MKQIDCRTKVPRWRRPRTGQAEQRAGQQTLLKDRNPLDVFFASNPAFTCALLLTPGAQKLRLNLGLIKASLSTENPCSPMGWVVTECDLWVTVFYAKAVYVHAMDGAEARRLSNDNLSEKN